MKNRKGEDTGHRRVHRSTGGYRWRKYINCSGCLSWNNWEQGDLGKRNVAPEKGLSQRNDRENDPRWMKDADPSGNEVEYGNGRRMIPGKE